MTSEHGNMQMVGARDPMLAHLRTTRLVCKDFAAAVEDIFAETYFSTWTVSLEQKSLSNLVAMLNHERLARHVTTLRVSNYALSRTPDITTSDFEPDRDQLALSLEGVNHEFDKSRLNELLGGDGSAAMKAYNVYKKYRKFVEAPELVSITVRQLSPSRQLISRIIWRSLVGLLMRLAWWSVTSLTHGQ